MRQPNLENLESYYTICLNDKITKLFSSTMLGIEYWKKHKYHTCYLCREKGHLANVCKQICPHCKNYHPGLPICIWNVENLFEKIYKILRKKECKRITDRYMRIVEEENKINNMLAENSAKEIREKNNIKKYEKLYIQNKDRIQFNGGKIYAFQKIYKMEDQNYHNYALAKNQTNTSTIYKIYSWISDKLFGGNRVRITDRIEYKSNKISDADATLTIESGREVSRWTIDEKNSTKWLQRKMSVRCIMPKREEWLKKVRKEALEKIKKQKNKIEFTNRFAFEKVLDKIKTVKDVTRVIENLKDKRQNLINQNSELMDKIEEKKRNLNGLKGRMNGINNEKNRILNAARNKGERIKQEAYGAYRYWFGKRTGYDIGDYDDGDDDDDDYDY